MINLKHYPPDWKILKLGQIGSFSKGRGIAKADLQDTGIPCIRYGEIYTSHHDTVKNFYSFISRETANCSRKLGFNDLLFTGSGETLEDIGKAVAYRLLDEAYVGGDVVILSAPEKYRADYIAYFLNSVGRYQLNKLGSGYSVVHIYSRDLEKVRIPLPQKHIQDRVVEILQTWDTAIEKTEKLITEKEKQFGWLATKLFNEQSEHLIKLGDFFGKSVLVEKGQPLIKAQTSNSGQIPVIAGGQTSPYRHESATHTMPCITVSSSGAYAGYVWYHDYPIWASDCNVIHSKQHSTKYLYFALKSKQSKIYALQSGGGQPHVYAQDLKNIIIPLPPIEEQSRIASILDIEEQEISLLKDLTQLYRTQKRGLMQKLMTGKWRAKQ